MRCGLTALLTAGLLTFTPLLMADTDPESGLVIAPGWEQVKVHCGVCHSLKLVTQNSGDRETWLGLIRWMQETQNLWPLPPEVENQVLDYLSVNYAARLNQRRPPLPANLMP